MHSDHSGWLEKAKLSRYLKDWSFTQPFWACIYSIRWGLAWLGLVLGFQTRWLLADGWGSQVFDPAINQGAKNGFDARAPWDFFGSDAGKEIVWRSNVGVSDDKLRGVLENSED